MHSRSTASFVFDGRTVAPSFHEVAAPDEGFYTQVYIGNPKEPVVEIEQFSPQWQAGAAGEFSMYVSLAKAR